MNAISTLKNRFLATRPIPTTLWRRGGLIAVFMATLLTGNLFLSPARSITSDMLGHDFLALYYGGACARTGHTEQLYDLPSTKKFEQSTGRAAGLAIGSSFGPWWNPPFAAWLFAPFAALPYLQALHAWWLFCALCLAISMALLSSMLQGDWKIRLLPPLLMLISMPAVQAFTHGQNTCFSLLLLTATVWLWRKNRPLLAGVICGLLFYKPQLGALVAAVLCLSAGRRAILGVSLAAAALAVATVLFMPGALHEFVYHMPLNLTWIQDQNLYRWERHVTLKAFWRFLLQQNTIGSMSPAARWLWCLSEAALIGALLRVLLKSFVSSSPAAPDRAAQRHRDSQRDRLIAATIIAMPLLMPFYFDYDLLLAAVGLVVFAADCQRNSTADDRDPRWQLALWTAIYLVMMFWKLPFTPTVPLLAASAALLIRRALRPPPADPAAHAHIFRPSLAA
jgi:hypothetical protein